MKSRTTEILAQFAITNSARINPDFWIMTGATLEEQSEVNRIITVILIGYAMSDTETQEIVELVGESHTEIELDEDLLKLIEAAFSERARKNNVYNPG